MKFGISTFITDEGIGAAELGRAVEERGFDSLFIAEHTHIPASRKSPYPAGGELPRIYYRTLDPFVALAAVAAVTQRLLVATGIALVVEREPITTAKDIASLDLVSGGRVIFGVGAGWNREEMRNHGTDPATRGALMDERIRVMREIWTRDAAEFHGEHVDFTPIYSWPKPVQRPHPPIYVGGESDRSLARVAEYGGFRAAALRRAGGEGARPSGLAGAGRGLRGAARSGGPGVLRGGRGGPHAVLLADPPAR